MFKSILMFPYTSNNASQLIHLTLASDQYLAPADTQSQHKSILSKRVAWVHS